MQRNAAINTTLSARRRARTLAGSLAFILAGAALYVNNVHAASQHPSHSLGSPMLAAATQTQAATTAWTSLSAACTTPNNWDAARRECVAVPRAASTGAHLFSRIS